MDPDGSLTQTGPPNDIVSPSAASRSGSTEGKIGDGPAVVSGQGAGAEPPHPSQLESAKIQDVNPPGHVETNSQLAEQSRANAQVFCTNPHIVAPSNQVLNSKDILPLILASLKETLEEPPDASNWQDAFTSIIRVNRSFYLAGVAMLWRTMTSVGPAFKLLPWHVEGSEYRGLATYQYRGGAADWSRFLGYTSLIRHVKLQTESKDTPDAHWVSELLFMLNGPPHLFPNVQTITVDAEATRESLPLLRMLVSNSLQSLDITTCDNLYQHEEGVDAEVQAMLPFVSTFGPCLQSFRYKGPVGRGFFHRIAHLKSVSSLDLAWHNPIAGADLRCLADLPRLRKLHLTTFEPVYITRPLSTSPEGAFYWPPVQQLKITGPEMLQSVVTGFLPLNIHLLILHLDVTRVDRASFLQRVLGDHLRLHRNLQKICMRVSQQHGPWPSDAMFTYPGQSDLDRDMAARSSFALSRNLKEATFDGVPSSMWHFMSSILQESIGGWKQLTSLEFRIQPNTSPGTASTHTPESASSSTNTFPGLSFLANTIWLECPNLAVLVFHFDKAKIMTEDLSRTVENAKNIAHPSLYPAGHPLRDLTINSGTDAEDSSNLAFGADRKVEIVALLEQLFPRLTSDALRGTPTALWSDMGIWLNTYRKMKGRATDGR